MIGRATVFPLSDHTCTGCIKIIKTFLILQYRKPVENNRVFVFDGRPAAPIKMVYFAAGNCSDAKDHIYPAPYP